MYSFHSRPDIYKVWLRRRSLKNELLQWLETSNRKAFVYNNKVGNRMYSGEVLDHEQVNNKLKIFKLAFVPMMVCGCAPIRGMN